MRQFIYLYCVIHTFVYVSSMSVCLCMLYVSVCIMCAVLISFKKNMSYRFFFFQKKKLRLFLDFFFFFEICCFFCVCHFSIIFHFSKKKNSIFQNFCCFWSFVLKCFNANSAPITNLCVNFSDSHHPLLMLLVRLHLTNSLIH